MRILGIDIGTKRIGLALSDELGLFAHPFKTIHWTGINKFVDFLKTTIQEQSISELVIGIPYSMKGNQSAKTDEILKIVNKLKEVIHIPIFQEDERLTTKLAEQSLRSVGKKPSQNRDVIDQIAATYILQSYLDRKLRN